MEYTQDGRVMAITTSLGKDVLLIDSLSVSEGISRLFVMDVQVRVALINVPRVRVEAILGKGAAISLELPHRGMRLFHGLVSRFSEGGQDGDFRFYYLQIVPWLWLLTLTSNCRIFQKLNAPEIIEKIFREHQLTDDFRIALRASDYTKRDYCVQYRETDFNFVSRLMEEEGIFYFFEVFVDANSNIKHKLVIADSLDQAIPCPNQGPADFRSSGEAGEWVTSWQMTHSLRPGVVSLRDYHYQVSDVIQEVIELGRVSMGGNQNLEVYDYPGGYAEKFNAPGMQANRLDEEGRRIGKIRMEEEETPHLIFSGSSYCRSFTAGFGFKLANHSPAMDGSYVLTTVQHSVKQSPSYVSGDINVEAYRNSFSCVPTKTPYRPPRLTPKPVVQGVQTAEVSGPKDQSGKYKEEVWTDEYGRILVAFHWDRRYKHTGSVEPPDDPNENSSAWLRVAQPWAGKNFGVVFIPRTGQEVLVDFEEGDPDRPIVVGSVYNSRHKPPYALTANKTQSGIKTRSSKEGSPDNFNEIRFEDKKGREELHIHAERTLSTVVEGSESRSIGGSRTTTIHKKDETLTIKEGNRTETLEKGNHTLKATLGNITIEAPAGKYSASAKDVEITGTVSVKIVCGASSIEMTPAAISIKSPTIEIEGAALTTVKGAMVKINC